MKTKYFFKLMLLFYSIQANNNEKIMYKLIENRTKINHNKISLFYKTGYKYITMFDIEYASIMNQWFYIPFVIYYNGNLNNIINIIKAEKVVAFLGNDKYSYDDYKYVKNIAKNNKNTKWLLYLNSKLSFLFSFFLIKYKKNHIIIINENIKSFQFPRYIKKAIGNYVEIMSFNYIKKRRLLLPVVDIFSFYDYTKIKNILKNIENYNFYAPNHHKQIYYYKNIIDTYNVKFIKNTKTKNIKFIL